MGCCASIPRSRSAAPTTATSENHAADSSRANINSQSAVPNPHSTHSFLSASSPADTTPRTSHHDVHRGTSSAAGALGRKDSRPNKPLAAVDRFRRCKPPKLESAGALTRQRLEAERAAFWDTRVTGHAEMWGVVRMAAESLSVADVPSAQGVLDAAGLTCPTGELWWGVYDEWGAEYKVPEWVVVEPAGVVEEDKGVGGVAEAERAGGASAAAAAAEEKGKGKMGEVVKVKARLSDRGTDVVVKVGMEERVVVLISKVVEAAKLPSTSRVRIAYLGKMLRENESLAAQGYSEGHVVNALVF